MIEINDLIGKPFLNRGRGPDGYDCWGLVREVYRRCGVDLTEVNISVVACAAIQEEIETRKQRREWHELAQPEVPCVLLIKAHPKYLQHLGVYVGRGKFLHVGSTKTVVIERISSPAWKRIIRGYWQYEPAT